MATSRQFIEYLKEQLSSLGGITFRPMMGEYLVYYNGKLAGDVCDDRLLIKPVNAAKNYLKDAPLQEPYEGAKPMLLVEDIDDREKLCGLFEAIYDELPEPKKKK